MIPRWTKFNYEIACAELCGTGHSAMKYNSVVDSPEDYEKRIAAQPSNGVRFTALYYWKTE
ncbi:MAG: hypothetical protein IPL12_15010 [Bacteroidetes bacterium]|nr:hypothetical protein [Bacteroidota bacterium]